MVMAPRPVSAQGGIAFVQANSATPQTDQSTVALPFIGAQNANDLNVVVVGVNDTVSQVLSVADSAGNVYTRAVGPTTLPGFGSQSIYFSPKIAAAAAGQNVVTVTFSAPARYVDVRIAEYRGLDQVNPVDAVAVGSGVGTTSSAGPLSTTASSALLVAANLVSSLTIAPGSGYTSRVITVPDGDILEDRTASAAGNFSATASLANGSWIMQLVAFRAAGLSADTEAPTAPASLTATALSAIQVTLTWPASSDNIGVTGYRVERCSGVGCSTFTQIGTSATSGYSDTTVNGSASYTYRVRATDGAGNLSGYSPVASATTPAAPDTQAPTAPSGLTITSATTSQVGLSWTAASDNVAVTNYLIERCSGAACSSFAQVGTSANPAFADSAVSPSTSYSYRVRATDAAGNLSGYSPVASATTPAIPDTQTPTAPTSLSAAAVSSGQIDLTWPAATDNVGVTGYRVERCVGAGCSTFVQVGTSATPNFSSTGLSASTSYTFQVRATDAAGNLSAYSPPASATTPAPSAAAFVQANAATPQTSVAAVTVPFTAVQTGGNLNVVVVGWNASSGTVQSVIDSSGNTYALAVGPTVKPGFGSQSIYYAANIKSATANSVTVTFAAAVPYADIRIAEYSGIVGVSPVDAVSAGTGDGALGDSGTATTTNGTDLLVGANLVSSLTSGPGTGFTSRLITTPDGDILEDRLVTTSGSYNATAPLDSGAWIMQMVAFKAGVTVPDTQVPSTPSALAVASASSAQVTLSWGASSDNVGVTGYAIERCSGSSCSSFVQVGTSAAPGYADGTVSASTSYSYRVRATDGAGNLSAYSAVVSVTTPAPPDTQAPTAPAGLLASAGTPTQVTLTWTASTDNITVTGYRIERCTGTGCSSFAEIGTSAAAGFSDTTVSGTTTYSYRVRATDAAGNLSGYSAPASVTTPTPPDTQPPTAPAGLAITASAPTQVSLGWTASTDNVGVTSYLVERCAGAGCGSFAQIGTSPAASFVDGTVAASTSYSYRVRATDAAGNRSGYSALASVTTPAAPDTQAPTAPASLSASAGSATQITLAWPASTDNVGVTGYRIERCTGAACTSFAQIGTSGSAGYTDNTAAESTSYSYRVQATDLAGNLSGYSPVASATTPAAPDTQAPTAPASVTATADAPTQVTLGWTASTDNVAVTSYLVERCNGASCSGFAQIGTSATPGYTDTTVSGSTSYRYRVRAGDAAGNLSAYSAVVSATTPAPPDTQAPTAPSGLTATATASSQVTLAWTASTDNVGVTGYRIERCTGATCSGFVQVGTSASPGYVDNAVSGSTSYTYRVLATDAAGNLSTYSASASATTPAAAAVTFVQANAATPQTSVATVTVPFVAVQTAGNLNVVVVGWNASSGQVQSVTDSSGNSYALAVGPTVKLGFASQSIYYAANIKGATANSVTVSFAAAVPYADIRIAEYGGILGFNPVDAVSAGMGDGALGDSGVATTTNPTDLLVGANMVSSLTSGPGAGFTARLITMPDGDILEDRLVTATGSYSATAPLSSGAWIMQMVAFKAGMVVPDSTAPSVPGGLTATAVSGGRIDLSWTAATDNVAVTGYLLERCAGTSCSSFGPLATAEGTVFSDLTVTADTAYSYRVRATDAAGNLGGYSAVASATTPAPDTTPPSAPGPLIAVAVSGTQIDLSWGAATDDTGVIGYRVERCTGAGCTQFSKFGSTITGTTFSDTTLSLNTSYSYIVRAQDAAGNVGPYTNVATAVTLSTNPSLVAAYSFDEGSGINVSDLSGHGNNGTLANATWTTAGKFGKALVFNGATSLVTIPDSPTLRLTTGMTLEAWVNPSVVNTGWKDIVYKGNDNYYLEGATSSNVPMIGITIGTSHAEVFGATGLPANTWTFLAATYDGANLRFYINGTQVASQSHTGDILTSSNPLQIGGDSIYGQFFQGTIDEVRVYNTALTNGQIQADMATAVGAASPAASLSSLSVDFGGQAVGAPAPPRTVTLTNGGTVALSVSAVSISGAQASDFSQTSDCIGSIAPFATCTITIGFTPSNSGTRNASVVIADNAPGNPHTIAVTGTGIGFGIAPQTAVVTPGQTQQFSVTNGTGTMVWSVDGLVGGASDRGTISTSGLYTPPAAAGTHTITVATSDGTKSATATAYVATSAGMFTHHNDDARTGQNLNETVLKPANVKSASFGKLAEFAIDGIAHASPLYVANVNVPGVGVKNVVYVATEHDSVYAFDADARAAAPLWKVSFINPAAGITTVPNGDTGECCDITPEIGITGTPVIDPSTSTLYVVAKTKEGTSTYRQRLHALDLATGAEKFGGPVLISASVPGTGTGSSGGQLAFDALRENQRTALLLHNGVVYFGFGSHGDYQPYHGWLLGYNATTLQQVFVFNATPNGEGGGIWQSGGGLAIDSAGNFFFATGDGSFSLNTGGKDYGDTFIKLSPSGAVIDTFTPHDEDAIDGNNLDLDAGGMILLPDQPGPHPHLLVSAGKNGTIYVVDRDSMGGFHAADQNVQTLANIFPFGTPLPGNYSSPVYYNGVVYFAPVADVVQAFSLTNGLLSASPTATTPQTFAYPGAALAISANGSNDAILWAVQKNGTAPGTLRAYDATNITQELYNSDQAPGGRDQLDVAAKFSIPLVINGRVYVASEGKLTIYGLLP
jgi:chitodextrinase/nitrogen fixation protein FixH